MKLKKLWLVLFFLLFLFPINNLKAQTSNVGFVPSNIWYSKDPFEEGDKIKIYTLVFNPDTRELSGAVIFFDGETLLGTKKFTAAAKTAKDISIDWTVTVGSHDIFAKMENAKFLISKGNYEEIYVAENQTERSKRNVAPKVVAKKGEATDSTKNDIDPITKIDNFVKEKTPPIVGDTIDTTKNFLEKTRENVKEDVANRENDTKEEIKVLNENKKPDTTSKIIKPLKYVELFFLTLVSFIFSNKIIFYGLLLLIVFFILRFLWRLIF